MVPVVDHAIAGKLQTLGMPIKFSGTPGAIVRGAPVYGQHSREILREAGYADSEIGDLLAENVVAEPSCSSGGQDA
jgi:crotonobetainyl-CoA:carnitine CoA-transferase CaiB-like acyl-CoA transferase